MKRIVVAGGGFAGLWSAVGAARALRQMNVSEQEVAITLVNRDPYHCIRVRNYEADLSNVRVPLKLVLDPIGIQLREGWIERIDTASQTITLSTTTVAEQSRVEYDRLVLAAGSTLFRPPVPGIDRVFSVDTYTEANKLNQFIAGATDRKPRVSSQTIVVVGAGLTGLETACELPGKLRAANFDKPSVLLLDHSDHIGSDMGVHARPYIEQALLQSGIDSRVKARVSAISDDGIVLDTGEQIPAFATVWTAGMRASVLTGLLPAERDPLGRLYVDQYLKVKGLDAIFAAGDVANLKVDGEHSSVMSCQHGRPMGRFAGYNVVADLIGKPMLPLQIDYYVTILDLGPWGAVYTSGWDRKVVSTGAAAKKTKQEINCKRIYPALSGNAQEILDAAAPVIQPPPHIYS